MGLISKMKFIDPEYETPGGNDARFFEDLIKALKAEFNPFPLRRFFGLKIEARNKCSCNIDRIYSYEFDVIKVPFYVPKRSTLSSYCSKLRQLLKANATCKL